ncbi:Sec-independent protein translocase protein TatB [Oceaniglobus roseus]|uniref:Sec-independent protein translocase protein TatB n=1 Tax=Oceaniglobus roseus TaxID=1737570 RepID=UPI000C7F3A52|nr:Sec-independent protein translocase protein TatB [Kandeliimicrobium roseum]
MFDIGWTELMVIGVVALIVVGPKDLPGMFRTLGRFTGKMKGMAREFQRAMEDAARDTGVDDVAKDLRKATSSKSLGLDALNSAADKFEKWQPGIAPKTGQRTGDKPQPKTYSGPATEKLAADRAAQGEARRAAASEPGTARPAGEQGPVPDPNAPDTTAPKGDA